MYVLDTEAHVLAWATKVTPKKPAPADRAVATYLARAVDWFERHLAEGDATAKEAVAEPVALPSESPAIVPKVRLEKALTALVRTMRQAGKWQHAQHRLIGFDIDESAGTVTAIFESYLPTEK